MVFLMIRGILLGLENRDFLHFLARESFGCHSLYCEIFIETWRWVRRRKNRWILYKIDLTMHRCQFMKGMSDCFSFLLKCRWEVLSFTCMLGSCFPCQFGSSLP
jgi:hypothetical protein